MSEKLIYAGKENGKHFFAPEYDDFIFALDNEDEFEVTEEYGGHYDRVLVQVHTKTGLVYKSARFPATTQDYVSHLYLVTPDTPSRFKDASPMGSVIGKSEAETVAQNIMTILSRTGDVFRPLSWDEYKTEREQDGSFSEKERPYFDQVIGFCKSVDTAVLFCPGWAEVA